MTYLFKGPIYLFLLVSFFILQLNAQQVIEHGDYNVSFYIWNYKVSWDSSVNRFSFKNPKATDFSLKYPIIQSWNNAEFIVTDYNGNKIELKSFEVAYACRHCDIVIIANEGSKLNKRAIEILNKVERGDEVVFKDITTQDVKQGKEILLPPFVVSISQ